ncbi:MAG TPA: hypothetical protein IGS52_09115 [Oscillatoriaceae cyanobacterium M33_DOE_052]|uniref:Uncharacterized protein n=1 Tax=Planktothricoides sp. SpSt-374 TaxID=2282167 RepID=A0A7C3ZIX9_9CYAN|nr:hypothetical protein [Oscillatoriaceae cyanobacterium M33_DOE_052]
MSDNFASTTASGLPIANVWGGVSTIISIWLTELSLPLVVGQSPGGGGLTAYPGDKPRKAALT